MSALVRVGVVWAVAATAGWGASARRWRRRLRLAACDPLTGLPTRAAWSACAAGQMRLGSRAVLFLDVDGFKEVNDTHPLGHAAGDEVLRAVAARLTAWLCGRGVAGRLGGDEFAAVFAFRADPAERLDDLVASLALPVPVPVPGESPVSVGVSVGVCRDASLSRALHGADAAMYRAKRAGGGWRVAQAPAHVTPNPQTRHRDGRDRRPALNPRPGALLDLPEP